MNFKKIILLIGFLLLIIAGSITLIFYNKIYKPNTIKEGFIYIPTNANFDNVENLIKPFLKNHKSFNWVAAKKKYPKNIKSGKYKINKGINNNDLINLLRSGKQTPVKVSFNNQDTFEKLAGRIAQQIEADSIALLNAFTSSNFLEEHQFNAETGLGMYIPNTYEFYWNTSAEMFRDKMYQEYLKFWNSVRKEQLNKLNLTQNQVITLASIVQKETAKVTERPMVAGLYLNRLNNNWPLQADPTIIFALKQKAGNDTLIIKRVLKKDLTINSPYNTYTNIGLPPGPIGMPDISSIDAVLNPTKHNYFYMCASTANIGEHEFSKTLYQHNINAAKYQQWLNKQGIKR